MGICVKHNVIIHYMESDKNHIHYMIETRPNTNLSNLVRTMKSYITYHVWQDFKDYLQRKIWKTHTFFTYGCLLCSIGNISAETLKKYIENQG